MTYYMDQFFNIFMLAGSMEKFYIDWYFSFFESL